MFYDPRTEKARLGNIRPVTALVAPRADRRGFRRFSRRGIVKTSGLYGFFNLVSAYPPWVIFSSAPPIHSQAQCRDGPASSWSISRPRICATRSMRLQPSLRRPVGEA